MFKHPLTSGYCSLRDVTIMNNDNLVVADESIYGNGKVKAFNLKGELVKETARKIFKNPYITKLPSHKDCDLVGDAG